jgi:hypothetical protein
MIQILTTELRELMNNLTFGSEVEPIDLSHIVDSMAWSQAFRRQDYSFISHPQNQDQVQGNYEYLFQRAKRCKGRGKLLKINRDTK